MAKRSCFLVILFLLLSLSLPSISRAAEAPKPASWELLRGPWRISGVAYGNGQYVASERGRAEVLLSKDGLTWTAHPIHPEATLGLIIWADTQFVGISKEAVWTSPDGKEWTKRFTSPAPSVNSLSYANGKLFVTNKAAGFWLSENGGKQWHEIDGRLMTSVAYVGGRYVGVHYDAPGIWTSPDGMTWQILSETAEFQPSDVVAGNGRAIVLSSAGPTLQFHVTTDGRTWQKREVEEYDAGGFIFHKGAFYLVAGPWHNHRLLRSVDGLTWTEEELVQPDSRAGEARSLWTAGEKLYLTGEGLWYHQTNDGSWAYVLPDRLHGGWTSVAWGANRWVATGYHGQLYSSPDGRDWQRIDVGIERALIHVEWTGDRFFAFSENVVEGSCREPGPNETCRSWVLQSKDGVTWTKSPIDAPQITSVGVNGGAVVAVDWGWDLWRSMDGGINWVKQPRQGDLLWDAVTVHDGYFWAIAEEDITKTLTLQSYLYRSKDGLTWEKLYTFPRDNLAHLSWSDEGLLVWGEALRVYHSKDLKTWETSLVYQGEYYGSLLRSVMRAEGRMVAAQSLTMGDALIQFKPGGWASDHQHDFFGGVADLAYHDGQFLAVGEGGSVYSLRFRPPTPVSTPTPAPTCGKRFVDVPASLIGCVGVESLAQAGVISGFPDGTFRPGATVKRAEIAKMLVEALSWERQRGALAFADTQGHWALELGYLQTPVSLGVLAGYPDGSFQPEGMLTRAQLVKVAVAAAKLAPKGTAVYTDIKADAWYNGWVAAATEAKLIGSTAAIPLWTEGDFKGEEPATRLEAAILLYNLRNLVK